MLKSTIKNSRMNSKIILNRKKLPKIAAVGTWYQNYRPNARNESSIIDQQLKTINIVFILVIP